MRTVFIDYLMQEEEPQPRNPDQLVMASTIEERTEENKSESFVSTQNGSGGKTRRRKDIRKKIEEQAASKRGQTIAGKSNCDDLSFIDEQDQKQLLEGEDQIALGEFENLEK